MSGSSECSPPRHLETESESSPSPPHVPAPSWQTLFAIARHNEAAQQESEYVKGKGGCRMLQNALTQRAGPCADNRGLKKTSGERQGASGYTVPSASRNRPWLERGVSSKEAKLYLQKLADVCKSISIRLDSAKLLLSNGDISVKEARELNLKINELENELQLRSEYISDLQANTVDNNANGIQYECS
nr:uncharacterized protein LOC128700026 isoform X2 [Cherax quadricarinatus]